MRGVVQIFRKRNPNFFSIEKVFALIAPLLQNKINITSISLPFYNNGLQSVFRNLYFLKKNRGHNNLYHVTGDVHYSLLALPAKRTILTIHDCVFLHASSGLKRRILKWLFLDMPVNRAAVVTTISEFSRKEILHFTNCSADKVIVVPNPVNEAIFYREKIFNTGRPVIFFIGTTQNKNLERTIQALENIKCRLCILGRVSDNQKQSLNRHRIDFFSVHNVSEQQLAVLYTEADIVLFPSTFEGFGLPILEGQKAGRVVITSNIDPMKIVAAGGAFLIDPFNVDDIRKGVQKVIEDADLRKTLIKKGFENLHNYNASHIANAYFSIYETVINNLLISHS